MHMDAGDKNMIRNDLAYEMKNEGIMTLDGLLQNRNCLNHKNRDRCAIDRAFDEDLYAQKRYHADKSVSVICALTCP